MKKITLFLMSLFLAFGTAVAKDEEMDFNSPEINPANGEQKETVYYISMKFPAAVAVEQTEVNIDVVNEKTNEVIKITSCTVDEWDVYSVIFRFEQKEVDGKDGKEYQDQYIENPGTYTYTIPEGLIKSVDDEVFAGGTYTFSVVGTFELTDWSPRETTELSQIVLTFEQEITDVKLSAEEELEFFKDCDYYNPITSKVKEASVDGNKVTLTLETPITAPGSYDLSIKQGAFVSEEAINKYAGIYFTVIDPTPGFETNYKDGDKVEEIGNLEISLKNVGAVELKNTDVTVLATTAGSSITGTAAYSEETGKITVVLSEALTEEGTYVFKISAGMFTMDGVENEARDITVTLAKQTILQLEIVSVTPVEDENGNITAIRVEFNQQVALAYDEDWQTISTNISLKDAQGNAINLVENYNPALPYSTFEYVLGAYDSNWQIEATPITEDGTYTLDLSQIVVNYAYDPSKWDYAVKNGYCEGTYTLVVGDGEGVNFQQAEPTESAAIYDLLGRRVEKITAAGIYIVNGRKMIVK